MQKTFPFLLSLVPVRCPLLLYLLLCFFSYVVLSVTLYQLDELQQHYQMIDGKITKTKLERRTHRLALEVTERGSRIAGTQQTKNGLHPWAPTLAPCPRLLASAYFWLGTMLPFFQIPRTPTPSTQMSVDLAFPMFRHDDKRSRRRSMSAAVTSCMSLIRASDKLKRMARLAR